MSQTLLFLVLHCVGVSTCLAIGPRHRVVLCCALGFATGLAVMVPLVLLMLGLHIPYTGTTGAIAAGLVIGGGLAVAARRGWPDRRAWRTIAIWTAAFTAISLPLTYVNLSFLTYDSHWIVMTGFAVFHDGSFQAGVLESLADYGVFQVLAHSLVGFTRESYLYGLAPVVGVSTTVLFAVLLGQALDALGAARERRGRLIALITAATFTVYMLLRHMFYIHTNFGSGLYLFLFVSLFWLAEVDQDETLVPISFLALLAFGLHRIENPLICALFLSLTFLQSRLPRRTLLLCLGLYTAATVGWYLLLASNVRVDSEFLTPGKCKTIAAITVVFFVYAAAASFLRLRFLEALHRAAPALVALATLAGIAATFALKYEHMKISTDVWFHNLWDQPYWEGAWLAALGLASLGLFVAAPPSRWAFVVGLPSYFIVILLLVYARAPYRLSAGDSAARMAIHLVPATFFYFGLKFIPLLVGRTPTAEPGPRLGDAQGA